jgi:hypothetical protein
VGGAEPALVALPPVWISPGAGPAAAGAGAGSVAGGAMTAVGSGSAVAAPESAPAVPAATKNSAVAPSAETRNQGRFMEALAYRFMFRQVRA